MSPITLKVVEGRWIDASFYLIVLFSGPAMSDYVEKSLEVL
jgi:hypothetical protein